ncbi:MAG: 4-amino-4-deoxy-L-arabinose-phosphoundecaprenol flippase subunit ArnE [Firmicutes bacterium ADurb.Bin456]|nr:MAG: 4-amino-4-deoxy-L-arabinose-phosphoundecaprenol flippase subunit ArnE [Firmicutes bacterium ADurb.Bin456]
MKTGVNGLKNENTVINPYLGVILAVIAVSFSSIFTKLVSAPPLAIAFYRLSFAVLILAPLALNAAGRAEYAGISRRDLVLAVVSGVFLALHFVVWITSLNYTSVASSTVLVTLQALFVVAGSFFFFKEKISQKGLAGIALTLTGSVLIGINDFKIGGEALWGDLLAFSGAFFVAVYFLIGRSLRTRLSLFPYVFLVYGASSIFLLLFNIATATPLHPYPRLDWVWFFLLALVPTILGHTVFNWALRYVKTAVVSVSILGEPVGATILAYFIFREIPGLLQLIGGVTIILGLYTFITCYSVREGQN